MPLLGYVVDHLLCVPAVLVAWGRAASQIEALTHGANTHTRGLRETLRCTALRFGMLAHASRMSTLFFKLAKVNSLPRSIREQLPS
jgi:hypothetical protein